LTSSRAGLPQAVASAGSRSSAVTLPDRVDPGAVDAKLEDGVLTVRVPKSEKAERRKIAIKAK